MYICVMMCYILMAVFFEVASETIRGHTSAFNISHSPTQTSLEPSILDLHHHHHHHWI
jgi:hypothetical protein